MAAIFHSPEETQPAWLAAALELLAWSARRPQLDEKDISRLTAASRPHLTTLKEKKLDSLFYLSCAVESADQNIYDKVWSVQRETIIDFCRCMADEGVEFYLFKGGECSARWYGLRSLGIFNDVDVLVARQDIGKVKALLYQNGFRQALFDPERGALVDRDVADVALAESNHYEIVAFSKLVAADILAEDLSRAPAPVASPLVLVGDRPMVIVDLDVHHGVATDVDVSDVTDGAQPSAMGLGLSFSDSNQVWLLTSRYYTEVALYGKRSLRDFCYILPVLACGSIDWDVVMRAARKYELRASLFYYFCFMSYLAEGSVPAEVLSGLSPTGGTRLRDWGWQLGKLFEFIDAFPLGANAFNSVTPNSAGEV